MEVDWRVSLLLPGRCKKCALVAAPFLLISARTLANWKGLGDVTAVYSHNGYHIIQTSISDNSCGTVGKFFWSASNADAKDMLAISLVALSAGIQVRVSGNFTNPSCLYGGAEVGYIMISQ